MGLRNKHPPMPRKSRAKRPSAAKEKSPEKKDEETEPLVEAPAQCTALEVETCLFCSGCVLQGDRRFVERTRLQTFTAAHFHASPFMYSKIADSRIREFEPLCTSCSCMMRRAEKSGPRAVRERNGLPIDRFLTYLVNPGEVQLVDCRCLTRIRESLSVDVLGAAWEHLPGMVAPLVTAVRERLRAGDDRPTQTLMVEAWWNYNGRPEYFSRSSAARVVRRWLKRSGGLTDRDAVEAEKEAESVDWESDLDWEGLDTLTSVAMASVQKVGVAMGSVPKGSAAMGSVPKGSASKVGAAMSSAPKESAAGPE